MKLVKLSPAYHVHQSERLRRATVADIAPARTLAENGHTHGLPGQVVRMTTRLAGRGASPNREFT